MTTPEYARLVERIVVLKEIAKEYNVSENIVCGINTGYYWFQDDIDYPIRK